MLRVRLEEWSSVRCRVGDGSALVLRVGTVRLGVRPLLGKLRCMLVAVRLVLLMLALQDILLLVEVRR